MSAFRPSYVRIRSQARRACVPLEPPRLIFVDDLELWVIRKDVRTSTLRVRQPDGRIEVTAPPQVSDAEIERFVHEKRDWIAAKRDAVVDSPLSKAAYADPSEIEEWRTVVEALVPPLVAKWECIMGVKAGKLAYRNMKSRWGSCQPSTGRICINVRLALFPPDCLEYVVVHELAHLIVADHGPQFYQIMDTYLPTWRDSRAKLR